MFDRLEGLIRLVFIALWRSLRMCIDRRYPLIANHGTAGAVRSTPRSSKAIVTPNANIPTLFTRALKD